MAALATIRKESGSTRWMLLSAMFQLVVTFAVYQVGILSEVSDMKYKMGLF